MEQLGSKKQVCFLRAGGSSTTQNYVSVSGEKGKDMRKLIIY